MTTSTTTSATSEINLNQSYIGFKSYCGYCAQEKTRVSTWLTFPKLSMEHYLDLLNIGWGRYMDSYTITHLQPSCCKIFAHRLDITKFIIRPSQRKVIKKWEKFLADKNPHKQPKTQQEKVVEILEEAAVENPEENKQAEVNQRPDIEIVKTVITKDEEQVLTEKAKLHYHISKLLKLILSKSCQINTDLGLPKGFHLTMSEKAQDKVKVLPANSKKYGQYTTNLLLLLYSENKQMLSDAQIPNIGIFLNKVYKFVIPKLSSSSLQFTPTVQPNGYISFAKQEVQEQPSRFRSFLNPKNWFTKISQKFYPPSLDIPPPYNPKVEEKNEQQKPKKVGQKNVEKSSESVGYFDLELEKNCDKLEIRLVKAEFDPEALEVYGRHCDARFPNKKESSKSEKTFREFFCYHVIEEQTIESEILDEEGKPKVLQIGCYHMKYYLEGKLIAMGVLDIIPTGMQSIYFFYDPDYSDLTLGSVGVLKEIDYMTRLQKYFPEFKYYYLSDYIQNCQRVKYKVEYEPAELLCPWTRTWVKFDEKIRAKIDRGVLWLADFNVKVIDDFNWKNVDREQFVMANAKINSQKYSEFDPEYAQKLMNAMRNLLALLGKKLFSEIDFKFQIKKPEEEAEKSEEKKDNEVAAKEEEKVEEKVEKTEELEEKKVEENIEEESMIQKDKTQQVKLTHVHSIRFTPSSQNNTLSCLNSY